jgi:hypothetical protein
MEGKVIERGSGKVEGEEENLKVEMEGSVEWKC